MCDVLVINTNIVIIVGGVCAFRGTPLVSHCIRHRFAPGLYAVLALESSVLADVALVLVLAIDTREMVGMISSTHQGHT